MRTKTIHSSTPFEEYKQPWETAKEGCWIITKKDGCTSTKRIDNPAYAETEAALAACYDIMVIRILNFRENNISFSAHELIIDTIKGLRQIIMKKSLTAESE
jgi:hypothetical protein